MSFTLDAVNPATISWSNINVFNNNESLYNSIFNIEKPSTQIIKNVSGEVKAGSTLAIMGSSGAGKTTLLNVLTARNLSMFKVDGVVKINGQIADVDMITSISAYVQQYDLFLPTLSVREHLTFQSLVRMDPSISDETKTQRINTVMKELSLEKCADTWVGGTTSFKGISGGEMKRLSFAAEILTNPSIMFCDEPTSGLDAFMAASLVNYINKMSESGRTIICTIHQPASEVFSLFKNLLLLADGRVAYFGEGSNAVNYFNRLGMKCPINYNPADFFIHELAVMPGKELESKRKVNRICDYYEKMQTRVDDSKRQSSFVNKKVTYSRYKASCFQQYQALTWRAFLTTIREPILTYIRLAQAFFVSLLVGIFFYHQNYDQRGFMNINGALFLLIVNLTVQNAFAVINVFCQELPIFLREHNSGMYRVDAYFFTKGLAEVPIFVCIPIVVSTIYYTMIGFYPSVDGFFYTMLVAIIVSFTGVSFGYLASCACNSADAALSLAPPLLVPLQLMGGFFLNIATIPSYVSWLEYLSWFYYAFNLLIINQWSNVKYLDCNMTIPNNTQLITTTAKYMDTYFDLLDEPNNQNSTPSGMCLHTGRDVIEFLGLGKEKESVSWWALVIIGFGLRLLAYLALCFRAKDR